MKKSFLLFLVSVLFTACPWWPPYEPYYEPTHEPVYMSRDLLEQSVKFIAEGLPMKQTGKIFYRYPYIFVGERYKGVHIIDNTDPYNPVNVGFVAAPGCIDMAVKGNILYVDNSVDLVSFDLENKVVTSRIRNVFPEPLPPDDAFFYYRDKRPENSVIVEWIKIEK
jgi:hypothetical protein